MKPSVSAWYPEPVGVQPSESSRIADWTADAKDLALLAPRYEAALAGLVTATPFDTIEWISAALAELHRDRAFRMLVCRAPRGHGVEAALPFIHGWESVRGLPMRTLRLAGYPLSDRVSPLLATDDPRLADCVLDGLIRCPHSWDAMVLNEVVQGTAFTQALATRACAHEHAIVIRPKSRPAIVDLGVPDRAALTARYPKSLKQRLKRSRKRLHEAGSPRFERRCPEPSDVPALLGRLKAVEDKSWKGQRGLGIFSTPERMAFFTRVAESFAARGWLDVGLLFLDGRLITYRFGFRFRKVFWDYNFAYLPEYQALSPGRILLDEMIQSSVDCGLKAFDASRGDARTGNILGDWQHRTVEHVTVWVFNRTPLGSLSHLIEDRVRPTIRRLRGLAE